MPIGKFVTFLTNGSMSVGTVTVIFLMYGLFAFILLAALVKDYGMHCKIFYTSSDVRKCPEEEIPVIMDCNGSDFSSYNGDTECNYFTRNGHFMVITDIDKNGNYHINDPKI